jgi:hypothetical protein
MHEIIFYNGFNLLVDIIIGGAVFFFTSRAYWFKGYSEGYEDSQKGYDYENAR